MALVRAATAVRKVGLRGQYVKLPRLAPTHRATPTVRPGASASPSIRSASSPRRGFGQAGGGVDHCWRRTSYMAIEAAVATFSEPIGPSWGR